jgi:hypothetical protein
MNEEQNNKIAAAREEIRNLEAKQADIYTRLVEDLGLRGFRENFFFDYIYNSDWSVSFDTYVEDINSFRK